MERAGAGRPGRRERPGTPLGVDPITAMTLDASWGYEDQGRIWQVSGPEQGPKADRLEGLEVAAPPCPAARGRERRLEDVESLVWVLWSPHQQQQGGCFKSGQPDTEARSITLSLSLSGCSVSRKKGD